MASALRAGSSEHSAVQGSDCVEPLGDHCSARRFAGHRAVGAAGVDLAISSRGMALESRFG